MDADKIRQAFFTTDRVDIYRSWYFHFRQKSHSIFSLGRNPFPVVYPLWNMENHQGLEENVNTNRSYTSCEGLISDRNQAFLVRSKALKTFNKP
jgi:hypothetical protein